MVDVGDDAEITDMVKGNCFAHWQEGSITDFKSGRCSLPEKFQTKGGKGSSR
jgi:hypothetical protein